MRGTIRVLCLVLTTAACAVMMACANVPPTWGDVVEDSGNLPDAVVDVVDNSSSDIPSDVRDNIACTTDNECPNDLKYPTKLVGYCTPEGHCAHRLVPTAIHCLTKDDCVSQLFCEAVTCIQPWGFCVVNEGAECPDLPCQPEDACDSAFYSRGKCVHQQVDNCTTCEADKECLGSILIDDPKHCRCEGNISVCPTEPRCLEGRCDWDYTTRECDAVNEACMKNSGVCEQQNYQCDDGNSCTIDIYNTLFGCLHYAPARDKEEYGECVRMSHFWVDESGNDQCGAETVKTSQVDTCNEDLTECGKIDVDCQLPEGQECQVPLDCDDGNDQTSDGCTVEDKQCVNQPYCDDLNACTNDKYVSGKCTHTEIPGCAPCKTDADCLGAGWCPGPDPRLLNSSSGCTASGVCDHAIVGTCFEGYFCTTYDNTEGPYAWGAKCIPNCDDGNPCTIDKYDLAVDQCVHGNIPNCGCGSSMYCKTCTTDVDCTGVKYCTGVSIQAATGTCLANHTCKMETESCDDHFVCTIDSCDFGTAECKYEPAIVCAEGWSCVASILDGVWGPFCTPDDLDYCDDGDPCHLNYWNAAYQVCVNFHKQESETCATCQTDADCEGVGWCPSGPPYNRVQQSSGKCVGGTCEVLPATTCPIGEGCIMMTLLVGKENHGAYCDTL